MEKEKHLTFMELFKKKNEVGLPTFFFEGV